MSKPTGKPFIFFAHEVHDSSAWRALEHGARSYVLAVWRRHNGRNTGQISFGQCQAERELPCNRKQAVRWAKQAQEHGFLEVTSRGHFNDNNKNSHVTKWRLTMEPCKGKPATNDWKRWKPVKKKTALKQRRSVCQIDTII